jgi:hypothetical protein
MSKKHKKKKVKLNVVLGNGYEYLHLVTPYRHVSCTNGIADDIQRMTIKEIKKNKPCPICFGETVDGVTQPSWQFPANGYSEADIARWAQVGEALVGSVVVTKGD